MHFVGSDPPSRKRSWNEDDADIYEPYDSYKQQDFHVRDRPQPLSHRRILSLSKRAKLHEDEPHSQDSTAHGHRRRSPQSRVLQDQPDLGNKVPVKTVNGTVLEPCHICHRKPVKRSDLDAYADCQGCGQRTCFVCIRECQGWNVEVGSALSEQEVLSRSFQMSDDDDVSTTHHDGLSDNDREGCPEDQQRRKQPNNARDEHVKGWDAGGHRAVVCSRCCIEKGSEGEIVCLGCLSGLEAG